MRGYEAETPHLLCCRTETERPSVPESVSTFKISYQDIRLDYVICYHKPNIHIVQHIHCTMCRGENLPGGEEVISFHFQCSTCSNNSLRQYFTMNVCYFMSRVMTTVSAHLFQILSLFQNPVGLQTLNNRKRRCYFRLEMILY